MLINSLVICPLDLMLSHPGTGEDIINTVRSSVFSCPRHRETSEFSLCCPDCIKQCRFVFRVLNLRSSHSQPGGSVFITDTVVPSVFSCPRHRETSEHSLCCLDCTKQCRFVFNILNPRPSRSLTPESIKYQGISDR
jgi:hypothetical protein